MILFAYIALNTAQSTTSSQRSCSNPQSMITSASRSQKINESSYTSSSLSSSSSAFDPTTNTTSNSKSTSSSSTSSVRSDKMTIQGSIPECSYFQSSLKTQNSTSIPISEPTEEIEVQSRDYQSVSTPVQEDVVSQASEAKVEEQDLSVISVPVDEEADEKTFEEPIEAPLSSAKNLIRATLDTEITDCESSCTNTQYIPSFLESDSNEEIVDFEISSFEEVPEDL